MTPPPVKIDRNKRHIKMRPFRETAWWTEFTAPMQLFILSGPTRTWTEINAWGKARAYTDVTILNMVAYLDLSRQIANIAAKDGIPLWGEPPPVETCKGCRAESETGQIVHRLEFHTCRKAKERAA